MTITKRYLRALEKSARISFSEEQKQVLLNRFGEEPWPHEWSEQDIQVQISNYLHCGHWEKSSRRYGVDEVIPDGVEL